MKVSKLLLSIFVLGVVTTTLPAQSVKGLKYVPQAVKGTKAVPYALNPKLPIQAQLNAAAVSNVVPGTAVQRAVEQAAYRQAQQTQLTQRLGTQLLAEKNLRITSITQMVRMFDKLSEQLTLLEEYASEHNGKLPWVPGISQQILADQFSTRNYVKFIEKQLGLPAQSLPGQYNAPQLLMMQVSRHIKLIGSKNLAKRYEILCRRNAQQLKEEAFLQREKEEAFMWELFKRKYIRPYRTLENENFFLRQREKLEQEWEWKAEVAQREQQIQAAAKFDKITDENAAKAAYRAETVLFQPEPGATEDVVEQLLNFYEKVDPLGANSFDNSLVFNSPAQWADKLEKFINLYHRAPARNGKITSQQMLDEHRLANAVNGLLHRLPKDNPDRQRIEQLLADLSEEH